MLQEMGAGEILLNSVERDGTWSGYDINLIKKIIHYCYQILFDLMTSHGIIHGDEHLNNFMLTDNFDDLTIANVKIIDFGKSYKLNGKNDKMEINIRMDVIKSIINSNINDISYHKNCPSQSSVLLPDELK